MSPADPSGRDTDRAALLGAALAAVVALSFGGEGEWDWLAAAAGVALLAVLAAFFRLPTGTTRSRGAQRAELAAVAAVGALAATLVLAAPLQALLADSPDGRVCRAAGAVAAGRVLLDGQQQQAARIAADRLAAEGIATDPAAVLAEAADNENRTVLGVCIGAVTTRWLWVPALVLAVSFYVVADVALHRARRTHRDRA